MASLRYIHYATPPRPAKRHYDIAFSHGYLKGRHFRHIHDTLRATRHLLAPHYIAVHGYSSQVKIHASHATYIALPAGRHMPQRRHAAASYYAGVLLHYGYILPPLPFVIRLRWPRITCRRHAIRHFHSIAATPAAAPYTRHAAITPPYANTPPRILLTHARPLRHMRRQPGHAAATLRRHNTHWLSRIRQATYSAAAAIASAATWPAAVRHTCNSRRRGYATYGHSRQPATPHLRHILPCRRQPCRRRRHCHIRQSAKLIQATLPGHAIASFTRRTPRPPLPVITRCRHYAVGRWRHIRHAIACHYAAICRQPPYTASRRHAAATRATPRRYYSATPALPRRRRRASCQLPPRCLYT